MSVHLTLRAAPSVLLEAPSVRPDALAGLSEAEIAHLPVWYGREEARLGDFFQIRGARSDEVRVDTGDAHVHHLGAGMTRGRLIVAGPGGRHAGAAMRGGEIRIEGDADDWTGAEMQGGLIDVRGSAGDQLAGAYPGGSRGMAGGVVLVRGDVGSHAGERMRRGLVAVAGRAGDYAAVRMIAGTLVACGGAGRGAGLGMKRGTLLSGGALDLLPTFRFACVDRPRFLALVFRSLERHGFPVPDHLRSGAYNHYSGDITEIGKGEILEWTADPAAS